MAGDCEDGTRFTVGCLVVGRGATADVAVVTVGITAGAMGCEAIVAGRDGRDDVDGSGTG